MNAKQRKEIESMTTFTFFLRDDSIREVEASDVNEAMRLLCKQLGASWYWTREQVLCCLSPKP